MDLLIEYGLIAPKKNHHRNGNEYVLGTKIWNEVPVSASVKLNNIDPKILRIRLNRLNTVFLKKSFSIIKEDEGYRVYRNS